MGAISQLSIDGISFNIDKQLQGIENCVVGRDSQPPRNEKTERRVE